MLAAILSALLSGSAPAMAVDTGSADTPLGEVRYIGSVAVFKECMSGEVRIIDPGKLVRTTEVCASQPGWREQ